MKSTASLTHSWVRWTPSISNHRCHAPIPYVRRALVVTHRRIYTFKLPVGYTHTNPIPFVVSFHGWRGTGKEMMKYGDRLGVLGDEETFAAAWPDGYSDHHVDRTRIWNSWNGVGSADSPGIEGPTCSPAVTEDFCYDSCKRRPQGCDRCDWTTVGRDA